MLLPLALLLLPEDIAAIHESPFGDSDVGSRFSVRRVDKPVAHSSHLIDT